MSVTSKSPLGVAREALAVGSATLRDYAHRFSPKTYTQPQLFACLVLKAFLRTDYRGVCQHLKDCTDLSRALGLTRHVLVSVSRIDVAHPHPQHHDLFMGLHLFYRAGRSSLLWASAAQSAALVMEVFRAGLASYGPALPSAASARPQLLRLAPRARSTVAVGGTMGGCNLKVCSGKLVRDSAKHLAEGTSQGSRVSVCVAAQFNLFAPRLKGIGPRCGARAV
jgi:hypothetical protein